MKAAVVFFISLFFLSILSHVLKGNDRVDAEIHHNTSFYSAARISEKKEQVKFGRIAQNFPLVKLNTFSDKDEDFISIENEDDDFAFTRKQTLPARHLTALVPSSAPVHFYNYSKNRLPFCRHLSYTSSFKYILQRVLRL